MVMDLLRAAGSPVELDPATEWIGAIVRGESARAAQIKTEHPGLTIGRADAEELPRWASAGDDEIVARLLDAGIPLDARGIDDGTALHYGGLWGMGSTVELLLDRGADPEAMGGPREHPGTPLAWTAWGSRAMSGAADRLDGYLQAATALLAAGARVTEGMIDVAADELAVELEEAGARSGILRVTDLNYIPRRPVRISVRRRANRYDIDDTGAAVAIAGRPAGWLETAKRTVAQYGWNINREGVVLMTAVEGRDIDDLVQRTAEVSVAVLGAILELAGQDPRAVDEAQR
jgi:ribosomal protein L12E/L44/L45/RPP1/RPP2